MIQIHIKVPWFLSFHNSRSYRFVHLRGWKESWLVAFYSTDCLMVQCSGTSFPFSYWEVLSFFHRFGWSPYLCDSGSLFFDMSPLDVYVYDRTLSMISLVNSWSTITYIIFLQYLCNLLNSIARLRGGCGRSMVLSPWLMGIRKHLWTRVSVWLEAKL